MFLLSKKCSLLLLVGIGLLLSTVPPSGAIICDHCSPPGVEPGTPECGPGVITGSRCAPNVQFCMAIFDDKGELLSKSCGPDNDRTHEVGCTIEKKLEYCLCNTKDLCNRDIKNLKGKGGKGSTSSRREPAAGTLLLIILGKLITARWILPGGHNTE